MSNATTDAAFAAITMNFEPSPVALVVQALTEHGKLLPRELQELLVGQLTPVETCQALLALAEDRACLTDLSDRRFYLK